MRTLILLLFLYCINASDSPEQEKPEIKRAVLDYVEGLYYGDTLKIRRSVHPDLSKYALLPNKDFIEPFRENKMTYEEALDYARDILIYPEYAAPPNARKIIEILDVQDKIASVKLTSFWGVDYLLLTIYEGKWMIVKIVSRHRL